MNENQKIEFPKRIHLDGKWIIIENISIKELFQRERMLPIGWIKFLSKDRWCNGCVASYPTVIHIQWLENRGNC